MRLAIEIVLLLCVVHAMFDYNTGAANVTVGKDFPPEIVHAAFSRIRRHQWFQFVLALVCVLGLFALVLAP